MKRLLLVWLSAFVLCATIFVFSSCDTEAYDTPYLIKNSMDKPIYFEVGVRRLFELPQEIPVGGHAQLLPRYFYMDISVGTEKKKVYGKQPYQLGMPDQLQIVKFYYGDSVYIDANTGYGDRYSIFRLDSWWNDRVLSGGIIEKHDWWDDIQVFSIDEAYLSSLPGFALTDSTEAASYVKRVVRSAD
ncbi:MAG: hypothetical protein IAC51_01375 [bacterium]|uniref:Lipoprotein n=1 Tax=Candidatus Aphodosoma intestinipullorum TaxID=2840674 RepID=A0A940DIR0_9BACT|nr:hypothetical protein [Candidatus Aphodosoma intestinipullorum]